MSLQAQFNGSFMCSGVCGDLTSATAGLAQFLSSYNISSLYLVPINSQSYSFTFRINEPEYDNTQANLTNITNTLRSELERWGVFQVSIGVSWSNVGSGGGGNTNTGTSTYTVVSGDTFSKIARRYGLTVAQLQALNPQVTNINLIHVGQVLNVSGTPSVIVATNVNPNTGQVNTTNVPPVSANVTNISSCPKCNKGVAILTNGICGCDERNWFDRTFFDGAGALTGVGIGVIVVLSAIVVTKYRS